MNICRMYHLALVSILPMFPIFRARGDAAVAQWLDWAWGRSGRSGRDWSRPACGCAWGSTRPCGPNTGPWWQAEHSLQVSNSNYTKSTSCYFNHWKGKKLCYSIWLWYKWNSVTINMKFNYTILFQILDDGPEPAAEAGQDQLPAHQAAVPGPGPAVWGHGLPARQQGRVQPQAARPAPHRVDETSRESQLAILWDICAESEHVCNCILIILYQTKPSIKRDVSQAVQ